METKDIIQLTEVDFEKAWAEWNRVNGDIPAASRRGARFFFFAGTQSGLEAGSKLYNESFDRLQDGFGKATTK